MVPNLYVDYPTPSAKSEGGNINISKLSSPNTGVTVIMLVHRTVGNGVISNLALAIPVKLVDFPTVYFFCMENKLNSCLNAVFTFLEKSMLNVESLLHMHRNTCNV